MRLIQQRQIKTFILKQFRQTYLKRLAVFRTEFRHGNFSKFVVKVSETKCYNKQHLQCISKHFIRCTTKFYIRSDPFQFLNDLCIKRSDLFNFADDNTITTTCNSLTGLLKTSEQEFKSTVSWFKQNEMIVNADKFKGIGLNKKESKTKYELKKITMTLNLLNL